jgi:hypothetical protein
MSTPKLGLNGGIFRCGETGLIYLVEDGKKRQFPNAAVYASWGSPRSQDVDCQLLNQIPDGLAIPTLYPGSILRCAKTGAIYKICQNGMKCHYPNMRIYRSYGSPKYQHTSCLLLDLLPNGPDIQLQVPTPAPTPTPTPTPTPVPPITAPISTLPPITAPIPMAIPRPENTIPTYQATVAMPAQTPQTGIRQLIEMPSNNNVYWILFAILIIIVLTFLFFKTR